MSFIEELKRRNVFRVGIAYAVVGWLLIEVAGNILPTFNAPQWALQTITFVIILGFPLALIFAWAFELTPEGLRRDHENDRTRPKTSQRSRKLDFVIIGALALALGYFAYDKFVLDSSRDTELAQATQPNP